MKCSICGTTVDTIEEAMENGWEPYFFEGETEHEFACPTCAEKILQVDENGYVVVLLSMGKGLHQVGRLYRGFVVRSRRRKYRRDTHPLRPSLCAVSPPPQVPLPAL